MTSYPVSINDLKVGMKFINKEDRFVNRYYSVTEIRSSKDSFLAMKIPKYIRLDLSDNSRPPYIYSIQYFLKLVNANYFYFK